MKHNFTISKIGLALFCAAAIGLPANLTLAQDDDAPKMTIGTKAPNLDVEHWVSDDDGRYEHVTKFEKGKVYIVEFWATWCGPCIAQMPHIAETQKKFSDKGVQFISISDEDIETVEEFLEKTVRGDDEERTYGELTNTYCLTTDPDKSVMKDYFVAAGRTGIPCAFIVGKTGLIEWIGHPGRMDKPIKQIVDDEWDRDVYLVEYKKEQEARAKQVKQQRLMARARRAIMQKMQDGEEEEAIKLIGDMINDEEYEFAKGMLSSQRLQLMIMTGHEDAASALQTFTEENSKNSMALNEVAWGIYERHEAKGDVSNDVLEAAKAAAEAAVKAEPESGAILDTLAHYIYLVDKDLDKAIETQKKAVKYAGTQEADIKPFLDQLLKEKKSGKAPKKKKTESDF